MNDKNRKTINIIGTNHHLTGCFSELKMCLMVCVMKTANRRIYRLKIVRIYDNFDIPKIFKNGTIGTAETILWFVLVDSEAVFSPSKKL